MSKELKRTYINFRDVPKRNQIEYTKEDLPADQVRAGLEKILLALGVDPKKRDSRSWAEILES